MARVIMQNLYKTFGKTLAVDHISLNVDEGEFMALLGPSGCGKTTTLRMVAGLENPTDGEILFDDTVINQMPSRDRNVAMVFERYALYPHLRVYENIATPLRIRGLSESEIDRRIGFFSELLEITDRLDHWPSQLSGGQRQRVGIARALVREPSVFLLDEPISHLDAKLRIRMRAELKKLQKKMGITTLYVTHDQVEAMTMADRTAVMESGKVQHVGTPDELFNKPANLFVAKFIGEPTMNVLPCSSTEKGDEISLEGEGYSFQLSRSFGELLKGKQPQAALLIGFRPQHCRLSDESSVAADSEFSVSATISLIEPLGTEQIVHLNVGDQEIRWIGSADIVVRTGDTARVTCPEEKVIFFDRETERNILA